MKVKYMWNLCHVYFQPMEKDLTRERSNMRFCNPETFKQLWKKTWKLTKNLRLNGIRVLFLFVDCSRATVYVFMYIKFKLAYWCW